MKRMKTSDPAVNELIDKMTLKEKVSLLSGRDAWHTMPIARLGIPALGVTDGPHGVRSCDQSSGRPAGPATAFPTGIGLAATWNPDLIERVGGALADETLGMGCDILLGPCVNIARTPLAGRNFEAYGEDPLLAGRIGTAFVKGVQRRGVGTSLKHFACNNQEYERGRGNSQVDERALREIYLTQFEMIVKEAQPWTVMCAYNRINGCYASQHDFLLNRILREEWGFQGIVISDWGANHTIVESVNGGLDIEMPGPARYFGDLLVDAVQNWQIDGAAIDRAVRRILRLLTRSGRFDGPRPRGTVNTPAHQKLTRRAAAESITLLKNEDGLLPLAKGTLRSIAIVGPTADDLPISGGGSAFVEPPYRTSPLQALRAGLGQRVKIRYERGCDHRFEIPTLEAEHCRPHGGRQAGLKAEYFSNPKLSGKPDVVRVDKTISLWLRNSAPAPNINPKSFSVRWSGMLRAPADGRHEFRVNAIGACRLILDGRPIVVCEPPAKPSADPDVVVRTSARVDLIKGRRYDLRVEYVRRPDDDMAHVRVDFGPSINLNATQRIAQAAAAAAKSDVAVVFVGLPEGRETEGVDRPDMDLTGRQNDLVRAVAAANPRTVVVLTCGAPVTMPWIDRVPAALITYYPGQEGGNAVADVLLGRVSPAGRLPVSFPRRFEDNPTYGNYPGGREVRYGEGVFVGYRYYDAKGIAPLFPFGHGLAYTSFAYTGLQAPRRVKAGRVVSLAVKVKNTGACAGAEVVQVYVADPAASVERPPRELRAFQKVFFKAGETRTVRFTLGTRALSFYDPVRKQWTAEPGEFRILVGASSRDIRAKASFVLDA